MSDKLEGIWPGDRVRVTFEGRVEKVNRLSWTLDLAVDEVRGLTFNVPRSAQIERIEPPLKVGDRVRTKSGREATVLAFSSKGLPVIEYDSEGSCTQFVSALERIA